VPGVRAALVSRAAGKLSRVAARVSRATAPDGTVAAAPGDEEAVVERAYRLILGRPADAEARSFHADRLRGGAISPHDLCATLLASPEFADRLEGRVRSIDAQSPRRRGEVVDVADLLETLTVEELAAAADEYYEKNLANADYYLAKPLTSVEETPDLLICFAQVLAALRPLPGMRVLDFGAGTCWSTRFLAQLGYEAIAVDVSATALEVGRTLFERLPVVGHRPAPTFLHFDGHRIDLPDASVDRVVCLDAFHHVPNPAAVLAELGRVLRDGGMAGFTEPGPDHSVTAQSQFEMRNYTVVENDILMAQVWRWAEAAGFTDLELAVFSSEPFRLSVPGYEELLSGGPVGADYLAHVRTFAEGRRIFFLSKGEPVRSDSRDRRGLASRLDVRLDAARVAAGMPFTGTARATNAGSGAWLASSVPLGGVNLGVHLYRHDGTLLERDHARVALPGDGAPVPPGTVVDLRLDVPSPPAPGRYRLGFDLVSEGVCWFEINGSPTVELPVTVT
jgi:SAM-dependent methyltransferase